MTEPDDDQPVMDAVDEIAEQQGWEDETVGNLALAFLDSHAPEEVRQNFLLFIRQTQETENEGTEIW